MKFQDLPFRPTGARRGADVRSSRGIALVITLILLTVITFMAVTFLVVSTTDTKTVDAHAQIRIAREAAEAGLQQSLAQIEAQILASTNLTILLTVSTNYSTPGFIIGNRSFTNVSYHYSTGLPLNQADLLQNLNNLYYAPSVPVWITNSLTRLNEFRDYFDANRNGRYDTNGYQPVINSNGGFVTLTGLPTTTYDPTNILWTTMAGDPQWVGLLERGAFSPALLNGLGAPIFPEGFPHSASNRFTSRYAFIVVPTSSTLDINNIHNYAKQTNPNMAGQDGFIRNQGVGSWELNLAAFLSDLNTNMWPYGVDTAYGNRYIYDPMGLVGGNNGAAFEDAVSLLRYRYNRQWNSSLYSVASLFGATGQVVFASDYVDGYAGGPLMTGFWWNPATGDRDVPGRTSRGWWGSDNTNHFYDPQDYFDTSKTRIAGGAGFGFTDRLIFAGTNNDTYNRSTFFRLLSQMGNESAPESPRLNLNYANVDAQNNIVPDLATNFQPWKPEQFFTNAIVRMLTDTFSDPVNPSLITNYVVSNKVQIQIYPTNFYSPAVHRILQLAANIFDAGNTNGTSNTGLPTNYSASFPTVFRPLFLDTSAGRGQSRVFINGYQEVIDWQSVVPRPLGTASQFIDLNDPNQRPVRRNDLVAGVPMVVGVKKGFPNFNEFGFLSDVKVTRTLTFHRDVINGPIVRTNQIYNCVISNAFGVEGWNSYSNVYPHPVALLVYSDIACALTNPVSGTYINGPGLSGSRLPFQGNVRTNINAWQAFTASPGASSFVVPLSTNYLFLTNSDYSFSQNAFVRPGVLLNDQANRFPNPQWQLNLTAKLQVVIVDTTSQRIVDYVNLNSTEPSIDIISELSRGATCDGNWQGVIADLFCTNRIGNRQNNPVGTDDPSKLTYGIQHQMNISMGSTTVDEKFWRQFSPQANDKTSSISEFRNRILGADKIQVDFSAPFSPTRSIHKNISWQANDPLVHYTIQDLTDLMGARKAITYDDDDALSSPFKDLGGRKPLNEHYRPWKGNPDQAGDTSPPTKENFYVKDAAIKRSDDWAFPTNKYPDLGWLGRVHRGTAWQTMNLKSASPDNNFPLTWFKWSAHTNRGNGTPLTLALTNYFASDFRYSDPTNDYRTLDLFTTAFNDNASRGQLSVNQSGLAAWSAVLTGMIVNTNASTNSYLITQPAGSYNPTETNSYKLPPLVQIVAGINRTRANNKIAPTGRFARMGDFLRTPELTVASPYINTNAPDTLNDLVYERIPQQILSLVRTDEPRFVIYTFGQALKPADRSVIVSGANFGLCTNYQITAETAARAVVHITGAPANPRVVIDSYNVLQPY